MEPITRQKMALSGACGPYSDKDVAVWADDPMCIDREFCAAELKRQTNVRAAAAAAAEKEKQRLNEKRLLLTANPFDPRTEISADAKHIASRVVSTLWIIFVLIPIVASILFEILK